MARDALLAFSGLNEKGCLIEQPKTHQMVTFYAVNTMARDAGKNASSAVRRLSEVCFDALVSFWNRYERVNYVVYFTLDNFLAKFFLFSFHNSKMAWELFKKWVNVFTIGMSTIEWTEMVSVSKFSLVKLQAMLPNECFIMLSWMHPKCRSICIENNGKESWFNGPNSNSKLCTHFGTSQRAKCIGWISRPTTKCSHIWKLIANSCQTIEWTWLTFELL